MSRISTMLEFVAARDAVYAEFGDRLMDGQGPVRAKMLMAAAPLAKFGKLPVERMLRALASHYAERYNVNEERADDTPNPTQGLRSISR